MTRSEQMNQDIAALLKSRHTLLWVVTREELRVERALIEAAGAAGYEPVVWDCVQGLTQADGAALDGNIDDLARLVRYVETCATRRVYILRDAHDFLGDSPIDAGTRRGLRNVCRMLQGVPRSESRAIVIVSPSGQVPLTLQPVATVLDYPLPERAEIARILDDVVTALPEDLAGRVATNGQRERCIDSALGLTAEEAANCFAKSLVTSRDIVPGVVGAEKKRVIARERVLTWYDPDPRGLDAIGGLELLKSWLMGRKAALSQKARDFGLPAPKGVLLVGVPGCGKSLTAKCVATAWGVPLLRLDLGALRSKYVGESEQNIRKALSVAEAVAPCVLWLDEIEKALAGSTGPPGDGGVSADALGAVLNWMQERAGSVFVVATANDVSGLPPELLRKGRFDDLFFVDLPTRVERSKILEVALCNHRRSSDVIRITDELLAMTQGFTGAELAAIVPDALFAAFGEGETPRPIEDADLITAAQSVVPLSKTAADRINTLRTWATGRCRPASLPETSTAGSGRRLDL